MTWNYSIRRFAVFGVLLAVMVCFFLSSSSTLHSDEPRSALEALRAYTIEWDVESATCQITSRDREAVGTLIDSRTFENGTTCGLVVTCAHLFPRQTIEVLNEEPTWIHFQGDINPRPGVILCMDWSHDLVIIGTNVDPTIKPVELAEDSDASNEQCYLTGFNADTGRFEMESFAVSGYTSVSWNGVEPLKHYPPRDTDLFTADAGTQLWLCAASRPQGDSGSPMVSCNGKLIGIFWGGNDSYAFGTCSGRLRNLLAERLPRQWNWRRWDNSPSGGCDTPSDPPFDGEGCEVTEDGEWVCPPDQPPTLIPLPGVPDTPPTDPGDAPDCQESCNATLAEIQEQLAQLQAGQETLAAALMQLPTAEGLMAELDPRISVIEENQQQLLGAMGQLQARVNEAAARDATVTLRVEADRFISPSYVDVSVLWALQQRTGVDSMVLVTDTSADHWERMSHEYDAAKEKFPAIVLYDVKSNGVQFRELPQLVIYQTTPDTEPLVISGERAVSERLTAVHRDEPIIPETAE